MIQNRPLILNRCEAFVQHLREHLYQENTPIETTVFNTPDRIGYAEAIQGDFVPLKIGDKLGPNWSTHWVKTIIKAPKTNSKYPWHLRWHSRSEACVWIEGEPLQAFSPDHRTAFPLPRAFCTGKNKTLYIEVAVNNLFGVELFADRLPWAGKGIGLVELAEIALFREDIFQLLMDFVIIFEIAKELNETNQRAQDALAKANQIINLTFWDDENSIQKARNCASEFLSEKTSKNGHQLSAIGHAHIDLAWLWPVAESKRKIYRTLSTAIANMERYPEYKFICSQMQIWEWIKILHPKLYSKMLKKCKEGQLIACGGSWVEPDCNLPNTESLLRQFIFGQRFMQKEFGFKSDVFWNPDVFGYSAQLPQILNQCGIRYFLTQKMSWNQYNRFPHSSFIWEGIDGSSVLAHFPPADNYNCGASVKEVLFNVANHKSGDSTRDSYMLYGYGDGGSGPTEEMIERIRRMNNLEGLPQVIHRTPNEFFTRLDQKTTYHRWVGELYLELHRGCQTTQAFNKKYNRKCEQLFKEVEQLYICFDSQNYPKEILQSYWKILLLNQFHDILPGSSIQEAYTVSKKEYLELHKMLLELKENILAKLSQKKGKNLLVFNPHSQPIDSCIVELPNGFKGGQATDSGVNLALLSAQTSLGYSIIAPSTLTIVPVNSVTVKKTGKTFILENAFICVTLNTKGELTSLFDKQQSRELIEKNTVGNALRLFDDTPNYWDAWDIEAFYREKEHHTQKVKSIQIVEKGPLRAQIKIDYALSDLSTLTQWISLDATSPLLSFKNHVNWFEKHRLLKVEFPWTIRSQQAAYEIQGGFIQRNTHENNSWDMAKFEVCAHRWADLSAPDYGIALLNDCKYGYHTLGNRMTLSLLRGCTYPDPHADEGEHTFTYAIYPHACATAQAKLHHIAAQINMPITLSPTTRAPEEHALLSLKNGENIESIAVKKAEDNDDIIIRFNESIGATHQVEFKLNISVKKVYQTNALEENQTEIKVHHGIFSLLIKPFEIITLRLVPQAK